jgi:hypothetical protein
MAPKLKFGFLAALVLGASSAFAGTIFSTTGDGVGYVGFGTTTTDGHQGFEYGDEIVMPTAGYVFTGLNFNYFAQAAGGTATLSIYDNAGGTLINGTARPNTLLLSAINIPILAGNNMASVNYGGGDLILPERFTYTVSFAGNTGVGLAVGGSTDTTGRPHENVGTGLADFWQRTGAGADDWALNQVTGSYGNFKVTVTANVPEPTTVALGVVGAAVLVGSAFRRNRR